jgi:hypothetical protein
MRITLSFLALAGLAGCPGSAPDNNTDDASVESDAAEEVTALQLSGKVVDYFGNVNVQDAMLATDGLAPEKMATSAADGGYSIEVAVGSKLFVLATKTAYRPTRNMAVTVADASVTENMFVVSSQDIQNQYTAVGATPTPGTAFVAADLRANSNQPLDGIPLTNIQLLDAANQPVAGVKGPYIFNAAGSLDMTATETATFQGRSRIAYLDVPPGTHTLVVTYPNNGGGTQTNNTTITAASDGATLSLSGGGAGGGAAVTDPSFATHIYPKLQRAAQGGLGCANCHTLTGPASVLKYDDPAATVLANITARPGVINITTPADSLLLVRPLYEAPPAPQDHPNATFIDVNDADYKLFLLWITNGAKP